MRPDDHRRGRARRARDVLILGIEGRDSSKRKDTETYGYIYDSHQFICQNGPHLRAVAERVASAFKSGAAKDDAFGAMAITFTMANLLTTTGRRGQEQAPCSAPRKPIGTTKGYLEAHGIIALPDGSPSRRPRRHRLPIRVEDRQGIPWTANVDVAAPLPRRIRRRSRRPTPAILLFQEL